MPDNPIQFGIANIRAAWDLEVLGVEFSNGEAHPARQIPMCLV